VLFEHHREVSSTSLDVRFVRQIPLVGPVIVRAEALHDGRSWGIAHVETRDERGRLCAAATVTVYGAR
jgi:acyl-coenzyme A thioesterase PaaI-like protein